MGFEQSKFGDGSSAGSGNVVTTVHNHYGPRDVGKTVGKIKTEGAMNELVLHLDAAMITAEEFALLAPELPAYSRVEDVFMEVETAFAVSASGTVDIGTEGSEATNGFTITETQLETVGVHDLTSALSGTWSQAAGLTSATTLGIDITGTVTTVGKAKVVIRYVKV